MTPTKPRIKSALKFESSYILSERINAYFDECDEDEVPYTLTGLCLAIGTTMPTLLRYSKIGPHVDVIQQARMIVQHQLELRLYGQGRVTGPIFALKQFGWSDRGPELGASGQPAPDDERKWVVEVVDPADVKKEEEADAQVSNSAKVTPLFGKKKAV